MLERARRPKVEDEDENRLARRVVKAGLGVPAWLRVSDSGVADQARHGVAVQARSDNWGLSSKTPATVGRGRPHPGYSGRGLGIGSRCSAPAVATCWATPALSSALRYLPVDASFSASWEVAMEAGQPSGGLCRLSRGAVLPCRAEVSC